MKYKVNETYTPDDHQSDRTRLTLEFESDAVDILDLALAAWGAYLNKVKGEGARIDCDAVLRTLHESDVPGQLADQDVSGFEFIVFGNDGEWCLEVEPVAGA
jgi:hypothetical protein